VFNFKGDCFMNRFVLITAVALSLGLPSVGRASITFQYVTDATDYNAATGNVTVQVIMQETVTGSSTSLSQSVAGTFSYGMYVQGNSSASGQSTISQYTSNTAFNTNPKSSTNLSNGVDFTASQPTGTTSGQKFQAVGNGVFQLVVGTLTIAVGNQTTFTLTSLNNSNFTDPGNNPLVNTDTAFTLPSGKGQQYDLDKGGTQNGSAGSFTFTGNNAGIWTFTVEAAATPEPGSMALCGLAAVGGGVAGYRRWRARRNAEAAV
jgi:hypothetical protein